ncbi:hypothetical protein Golax_004618 [Gossypium laxum]|uniref:Uncharacterized protein n=1 Tax=Gossypium laxum TaxID=34288 RepID=A0A7J9B045_9ROSI|nr:hypothetical protein [Gossypium laxum]
MYAKSLQSVVTLSQLDEYSECLLRTDLKPNEATIANILSVYADLRSLSIGNEIELYVIDRSRPHWFTCTVIVTSASKRKEAAKTRSKTRNKGLVKTGWSRIEINGLIHVFMAGDQSDHQSVDIYEKLNELNTKLKEAGYVAESHHGKNY